MVRWPILRGHVTIFPINSPRDCLLRSYGLGRHRQAYLDHRALGPGAKALEKMSIWTRNMSVWWMCLP
jgi:hypothetical protein